MRNLETSIVNSALWAAAGDAIGWISELTDSRGLERRAGTAVLSQPVRWKRKIGGIRGALVEFEPGSYSDDTQLRLAVSRSIRGDGVFDAEPFAKIELPVWLSYALGAGIGSKAAATNLLKRDVNWFSNFFALEGRSYVDSGGNGAAMRIQPHVWACAGDDGRSYLDDVLKDALVTHGNMRGVCGAVFHADCLAFALTTAELPGPKQWRQFIQNFGAIEEAVHRDFQLARFWLSPWEQMSRTSLSAALREVNDEMLAYLDALEQINWGRDETYAELLEALNALSPEWRGTGSNTAIAAAALAWDKRNEPVEVVILEAANAIGSDTDTIGTMAGALAGAVSHVGPAWEIQDTEYLVEEAKRMAQIAQRRPTSTFRYPDLIEWQPPSNQSDAVGRFNGALALSGLGPVEATGRRWKQGDFAWQWFKTAFGQTILCKTRAEIRSEIGRHLVPQTRSPGIQQSKPVLNALRRSTDHQVPSPSSLPLFEQAPHTAESGHRDVRIDRSYQAHTPPPPRSIDELTELVIQSNFDPRVMGNCLIECSQRHDGIEKSLAFAAIIAKALAARRRRLAK